MRTSSNWLLGPSDTISPSSLCFLAFWYDGALSRLILHIFAPEHEAISARSLVPWVLFNGKWYLKATI